MYPHRINLREPWNATGHPQGSLHRRVFRWPTALLPFEELWLVVGWANSPTGVYLNQQPAGSQPRAGIPLEINLTALVQDQNLLEIVCQRNDTAGRVSRVFLEVRRSVHLSEIVGNCRWNQGQPSLELNARIRGIAERKLSMVIRLNEREVHYEELTLKDSSVHVKTGPLHVPVWQPGKENVLQQLHIDLLDPSCVLSQHHYLTAFCDVTRCSEHELIDMPDDEPLLESPFLEAADRMGKLVQLRQVRNPGSDPFLWHHPCLRHQGCSV